MKIRPFCLVLGLLAANCLPAASLIIENVRIVDVVAGATLAPRNVRIEADRIVAIAPAGAESITDAVRIDGTGRFLAPGLWDMHVHINDREFAQDWALPLFLASGVTGVRDMAGDCWSPGCKDSLNFTRDLQRKLEKGHLTGPRILAISSAAVDGPRATEPGMPVWATPGTAVQGKQLVREAKRRGVDLIKAYDTIPRDAYFGMMKEARALGLPVAGHVPLAVSLSEAVQAGQQTIDHARHPVLDCSRFSRTFHQVFEAWASGDSARIYRSWADDARPADSLGPYYQPILALYDASLCKDVIATFAASGAYYVPTLITRKFEALADEQTFLSDPRLESVPTELRGEWDADAANYRKRFADINEKRAYVGLYELALQLVGDAHRAGVPMLVGTDTPDSYCFPGSGYHDELLELRDAGLANDAILRAATINGAKLLGLEHRFGSVSIGKTADLLLLEADPLVDIANARKISSVILNGKVFDAQRLELLRAGATAFAKQRPASKHE